MSGGIERAIAALAARQHGVITQRQLLECGLSSSAIHRRLRCERLRRLHRGVYLAAPFPLPRTREMAAVLAAGEGAVLSHRSAAALWGLRPREDEEPVDVSSTVRHVRRPGVRAHRVGRLEARERTTREGVPVTTPARTLADVALVMDRRELEQVVARAEREGLVNARELDRVLANLRGRKGSLAMAAVLKVPGGISLTRSEAEARFLALVRQARLPAPECNVRMGEYELDFYWRGRRIAVEVDGYRYHANRRRFEGDRRRDMQLLAQGVHVVRISWRQITEEPLATAAQLGQALAGAPLP